MILKNALPKSTPAKQAGAYFVTMEGDSSDFIQIKAAEIPID